MTVGHHHVVYLTGAPATGKSTLVGSLRQRVQPLQVYSYSKLLADHINARADHAYTQDDMRRESAKVITAEDVAAVDRQLLVTVDSERRRSHVIIDSHAVTKEHFGFRVTPFSIEQVKALAPTIVAVLYAESEVILGRIRSNNQGRPLVSQFDATFHNGLQASVALTYGIHLGVPVYFFDSNRPPGDVVDELAQRMER